jgi:tRNA pseudouridine13 synthase
VSSADAAQALENAVAARHAALCDGLEHAGLEQERRALLLRPADLAWEWPQGNQLLLTFALPAGSYATSVLDAILRTTEPERLDEAESAALA